MYKTVDDVSVNTCEVTLLKLLLKHRYCRRVKLSVKQQYAIALHLCSFDIRILLLTVCRIKIYELSVLVCLLFFDESAVLIVGEILSVNILKEGIVFGTVVERLVAEHTIVDEEFQIVPFFLKSFPVFLEKALQAVADFLCDICRDLLHIPVTLEIRTAYVKWDVW